MQIRISICSASAQETGFVIKMALGIPCDPIWYVSYHGDEAALQQGHNFVSHCGGDTKFVEVWKKRENSLFVVRKAKILKVPRPLQWANVKILSRWSRNGAR